MKKEFLRYGLISVVIICAFTLVSCGGGGGGGEEPAPEAAPEPGPGPADSVTLSTGATDIVADGASQARIKAEIVDSDGNPVANGTTVTFTTTAGSFSPLTTTTATTTNGVASVYLTSTTRVGSATITATVGGVSNSTTVTFIPGAPAQVNVTATPTNLTADGTSTSTIGIIVLDANNNPVADGETVSFSVEFGSLDSLTASTTAGMASVIYTAPTSVPLGNIDTVTVETTNGQSGSASINLIGVRIASIELTANPTSLPADESSQATISATLTVVGGGSAPDGTTVNFEIVQGAGHGDITSMATTGGGVAIATLTSGNTPETVTIRAVAGGRTAEIQVEYTPGSVGLTIVPNSLLGTGQETATVTATLKTASGGIPVPYTQTVAFTLDDLSLGTITPYTAVSNAQGEAQATFQDAAKGGTVTITATWTTGGVDVTGSETVTIQPPPAFIQVADGSPDPAAINIRGTGGQSTSQVTFDVKDSQGNLVSDGYRIDLSIESGPNGGEEILPLTAYTTDGQVSTILTAGFKSGPVMIKATYYHDTNISTTTSQIAINAGPPVGEEFGIFAEYLNISGWWKANLQDNISVNVGDIYGNAIPDDTAISFKTYNTGGFFTPNTATTTSGLAINTLHSGGTYPEPMQGFVSVTAEANNGGRTTHVTSLAVTPLDNNIIYAGTDGGGVYKSTDFGASWTNISRSSTIQGQNWIDPYVNDIVVDPDNKNTLYAATGYLGTGNVYRSLDGGLNWNSNNMEEWNGIFSTSAAILTVLCDGDDTATDYPYVWIGTEGMGALLATDGKTFQGGGKVEPTLTTQETVPGVYDNPANTGDGKMTEPTLSSASVTEDYIVTYVVLDDAAATVPVASEDNKGNGTMFNVTTDSSATQTENWTVTYVGGVGGVTPGGGNLGDGTVFNIGVKQPNAGTETWTLTCFDATKFTVASDVAGPYPNATVGTEYDEDTISFTIISGATDYTLNDSFTFTTTAWWKVTGTVSGAQTNTATTGAAYGSDNNEVGFTVTAGSVPFIVDDQFTFSTTAASMPYWNVQGTVSGPHTTKAYNGVPYASDNGEVSFVITPGATAFAQGDTFAFRVTASGLGYGKTVGDIIKVPLTHGNTAILYAATATGVYTSTDGGLLWSETKSFTGDHITTLAVHPTNINVIYAGTQDAGVWVSTTSGADWTAYTSGMGKGLSASTPVADSNNKGNGVMSEVTVGANTLSEYWLAECIAETANGGTFAVTGTVSGGHANATVGTQYISNNGEVSFTISDGSKDFELGDIFTFSTTRDSGREIRDLLVDPAHHQLYAVTYFWGPLEPHAVGNVYAHALNANGSMAEGDWSETNTGLPQYDPPDDTTLFAQHVIAVDNPDNPNALYIGGEGIHLYKAVSGFDSGNPSWQVSESGLTNLIMARMPILFSGECAMSITEEVIDNRVEYTVYIQDTNGNPPIANSTFTAIYKPKEGASVTLADIIYPDCYTHTGTFRDPANPATNNPYRFAVTVSSEDEVKFTFNPTCECTAPGCSGSAQTVTYPY